MNEITLRVASNPNAPGVARRHLQSIRSALEPRFDDVLLLVSELVTNSVRHSGCADVDLSVTTGSRQIRVEVADCGPGFISVTDNGDGLGLQIVDRLADEWGFSTKPKFTVWARLAKA